MKNKQKIDTIIALCLILLGVIILILPLFQINDVKLISVIIFSTYTILNSIKFILNKESKDYEGLHYALSSLIILIVNLVINLKDNPRNLAMSLMAWIILMSLAKLKKMDYYHDRRDRMWKIRAFNLGLFILTGTLASINLAYNGVVQMIVIGFFLLIHGILELFDPLTKTLIAHS